MPLLLLYIVKLCWIIVSNIMLGVIKKPEQIKHIIYDYYWIVVLFLLVFEVLSLCFNSILCHSCDLE